MISRLKTICKNILLKAGIHTVFSFLTRPALLISNTLKLSKWIHENVNEKNKNFVSFSHRQHHYEHIYTAEVKDQEICYLEFGVFKGESISWWVQKNINPNSSFYGFDTFKGLPEKWGNYTKGDFYSNIPNITDTRVKFIKGLFQDTLHGFLKNFNEGKRLVIHLDADLFSSTLFVLTSLAPILNKGDIILFDEFNVPNDEFSAFEIFCRSYYINFELLSATRNCFQIGVKIV
jgi:O-methyltransferase